jgi:hypothetical protein
VSPLLFAHALIARWSQRVVWPRPLGMIFLAPRAPERETRRRRPMAPQLLQGLRQSVHVDLRPTIALTLVRPLEMRHSTSTRPFESRGSGSAGVELEQLVLRNSSALMGERVLERALSRSRRVELLVRSAPAPGVTRGVTAPDLPPQLVVQRAPAPGAAESPQAPRQDSFSRPSPRELAQHELDLGRLTDSVVTAIDGRLTAHAERLGRG